MNLSTADLMFIKSSFTKEGIFYNLEEIKQWLRDQNQKVEVKVAKTTFDALDKWGYDKVERNIRHASGKFFSIDGINIRTNWGTINQWDQPIINQPEIGYLGMICKEFNGVLYFLLQAKIEPGNINHVQLSPTLQATRSNYSQVHGGKKPVYLEYFQHAAPDQILLDQLQSEQGARFLRKRNRNIIIKIEEDITVHDNFIWLTLAQVKLLMQCDNLVNMDTRTVIAGIPYGDYREEVIELINFIGYSDQNDEIKNALLKSALIKNNSLHSIGEIITFLTHIKSNYDLEVSKKDLKQLDSWIFTDHEIAHVDNKFFKIIAVNVNISSREVVNWSQPMVQPAQEGLCAFICKEINGVLHFAVQAKLECGNRDIIEFAPTVQCLTGNYKETKKGTLPFLDYVLNAQAHQIVFDALQSEEGGRFYHEQNRNMLIIAGDEIPDILPDNYIWMTMNQLYTFLKFNNYLNIQARSLIAGISFV
ncbi:oxidase EvaA [Saccharicrinis carchari]|uniref:Oxidase EvaA n=1 Tax=Saccharicrinis carchari TaxID=1168039 RepID=A0A521AL60_SACCC|nr:NDP-hexose 2,3-dehydratase family protein [Saccharicrinis carchari]SMO35535.1 oxidase EvaA [Saccharicrinis carchari]